MANGIGRAVSSPAKFFPPIPPPDTSRFRRAWDGNAASRPVHVPFEQDRNFPIGFDEPISLADYLAITADWDATNQRRHELLQRKRDKTIQPDEGAELERLQHLAGLKTRIAFVAITERIGEN
jgi:hypothetical protein